MGLRGCGGRRGQAGRAGAKNHHKRHLALTGLGFMPMLSTGPRSWSCSSTSSTSLALWGRTKLPPRAVCSTLTCKRRGGQGRGGRRRFAGGSGRGRQIGTHVVRVGPSCVLNHVHTRPPGWNASWAGPLPAREAHPTATFATIWPHLANELHCGGSKASRADGTMPPTLGVGCRSPGRGLAVARLQHVHFQLVVQAPAPGKR
jgi:hypothetical protein